MGGFLDKPKTEKHNEHGTGNGLSFGVSSMQGWRIEMEDAHCAYLGLPQGLEDWSFFAVFDGHAGASVSAYCAKHLMDSIVQTDEFKHYVGGKNSEMSDNVENIRKGIRAGFLQLDEKMRNMPEIVSGEDKSGSTAVCTLISPTHMFIANCGDSRAVLSRNGTAAFSTLDHKPINPMEKERIQNAGGSVMIQRVNGSLAVSRALGDFEYKQVEGKGPCEQLVSPEPEVNVEARSDNDEFLILACDGVWDVMSNDELCDFVRSRLQLTESLEQVCNQVVDACLHKGSRDNMSIVLVSFPGAPKASQEAITKEKELERILEKKVTEAVEQKDFEVESFNDLIQYLENEELPGLPPGAGLAAKTEFLESVFNRVIGTSES